MASIREVLTVKASNESTVELDVPVEPRAPLSREGNRMGPAVAGWRQTRPALSRLRVPTGEAPPGEARFSWLKRPLSTLVLPSLVVLLSACSTTRSLHPANTRPFQFETDTFAYANELVWEYYYDQDGKWRHQRNESEPDYTHHCFVVARSARQFFQHARFDATLPEADPETYRALIKQVCSRDPSKDLSDSKRVVIPGYPDLRSFSEAWQALLKDTCGAAIQSYFQRGHWRMIFPFSRNGQAQEAEALAAAVRGNRPPIVHVVTFPWIRINHALLLIGVSETDEAFAFTVYDPNQPEAPALLTFDRRTQTFHFPSNDYWIGGELNVYEVYRAWNY